MRKRIWARAAVLTLAFWLALGMALAAGYIRLEYGSKGPEVQRLQQALNQLGYKAGTADGKFGAYTENAVRSFQRNNGLKVDGIAGTATQELLFRLTSVGTTTAPAATPAPTAAPTQGPAGLISFYGDYTTIQYNDSGSRVKLLQSAINTLGYGRLTVDGKFGTGTLTAVMAFQRAQGLTVDGKAGRNTLRRMEALGGSGTTVVTTPAPTQPPAATLPPTAAPTVFGDYDIPARTLYPGSVGDDVKSVQRRLRDLGYYKGSIDGQYGTGTVNAVTAFQQNNRLTADGVAGAKTFAKLYSASAVAQPAATATPVPTATPAPAQTTRPPAGPYSTLKKNATGPEVERLQSALAKLDYQTSTYGTYDNTTVSAVKDFQQRNGLTADGIAGPVMQTKLYSGSAVRGTHSAGIADGVGESAKPALSQVKLLHWYNDVKGTMLRTGQNVLVYDPVTNLSWKLYVMSCGRHADVEPKTAQDTAIQYRAFGNREDWGPKAVYVQLPNGAWTIGGLSNVAHNTQTIHDNNFNGQNCLHFLRDMAETQRLDPKTGVRNQNTIREFWKKLTGQEITK